MPHYWLAISRIIKTLLQSAMLILMSIPYTFATVTLSSPPNNSSSILFLNQQFIWQLNSDADNYRFALSTDPTFPNLPSNGSQTQCVNLVANVTCFTQGGITQGAFTLSSLELQPNTTYFWKVRDNVSHGVWSPTWSFTTQSDKGTSRLINSALQRNLVIREPQPNQLTALSHTPQILALAQQVTLRVDVHTYGTDTLSYSENHTVTTDDNGIAVFEIGKGIPTSGIFNNLLNTTNAYYARTYYKEHLINIVSIILPQHFVQILSQNKTCNSAAEATDHKTIQDALDNLKDTGGRVIIPAGKYCLGDPIFLHSNTHLVGHGDTQTQIKIYRDDKLSLKYSDNSNIPFVTGCNTRYRYANSPAKGCTDNSAIPEFNTNMTIGHLSIERNTGERFNLAGRPLREIIVSLIGFNNQYGNGIYDNAELNTPSAMVYNAQLSNNSGTVSVFQNMRHASVLNSKLHGYTLDPISGSDVINTGNTSTAVQDHGNLIMFGTGTRYFEAVGNTLTEAGDTGVIAYNASYGAILRNTISKNRVSGINSYRNSGDSESLDKPDNYINSINTHIAIINNTVADSIFDSIRIETLSNQELNVINRNIDIRSNDIVRSGMAKDPQTNEIVNPGYSATHQMCNDCGRGIHIFGSKVSQDDAVSNISIHDNAILGGYVGIVAGKYGNAQIHYSNLSITNNIIQGNSQSILLSNVQNSRIENNQIGSSRRSDAPYEVLLRNHTQNLCVESNTLIAANGTKVAISEEQQSGYLAPQNNTIFGNTITGYPSEIQLHPSSGSSFNLNSCTNPTTTSRIINLSTRALTQADINSIIAGFIIQGTGTCDVMIRGFGKGIGLSPNLDTQLELQTFPDGVTLTANRSWQVGNSVSNIPAHLHLPDPSDAGIYTNLSAGAYTVTMTPEGTTGIGLIGVDEVRCDAETQLINISTRAEDRTGAEAMIAGFTISGEGTLKLMIRGFGSGLGLSPCLNTKIELQTFPAGESIASNDDWQSAANAGQIPQALQLPHATDAGLLVDLPAGAYTAIMTPVAGACNGIGLIGVDVVL